MSFMFHKSIRTKWLALTNKLGSRVRATIGRGNTLVVHWDYALNVEDNHARAAMALARKLGWVPEEGAFSGTWRGAGLDDSGFVFVSDGDVVPVTFGEAG
jgi:hypothetical protein